MRNLVAHGYGTVSTNTSREIVAEDISTPKPCCTDILNEETE
ncbi:hypothetical protein [Oscillibacter sp.]|nr:hypothetical protein [Oscillibacter sp.]